MVETKLTRWKITLEMDLISHPRKWLIEALAENMELGEGEDLIDWEYEEVKE